MEIKSYQELLQRVQDSPLARVAVVAAADPHTIEGVLEAQKQRVASPVLIGDAKVIAEILKECGEEPEAFEIFHEPDISKTPLVANELVHSGKADFVMKGLIDTADFLKGILDKESGLRTGNVMSHIAFLELPGYRKLLAITDGGMIASPDLDAKRQIVQNVVCTLQGMGYEKPKIAVLAAVEKENKSMSETSDAFALRADCQKGRLAGCEIDGPLSYDIAMSKEAARIKGISHQNSEDYDVLLVPGIAAGNILTKALILNAGAKMAGIVAGAKVPLVLNSRSASADEKFYAILLAAAQLMFRRQAN